MIFYSLSKEVSQFIDGSFLETVGLYLWIPLFTIKFSIMHKEFGLPTDLHNL